jgi:predicted DNA binding CopG/RHH family protein
MTVKRRNNPPVPVQPTENEEHAFWQEHDSTEFIDWENAQLVVLPHLKPTLRTISLRLPESMITHLKVLANRRDIPYQSLLKIFLAERLDKELGRSFRKQSKA